MHAYVQVFTNEVYGYDDNDDDKVIPVAPISYTSSFMINSIHFIQLP